MLRLGVMHLLEKKKKTPLVKEIMNPLDGPFKRINYDFEYITKDKLDLFFVTEYGNRTIAPLLEFFVTEENSEYVLSEDSKTQVSAALLAYYSTKWDKLKEVLRITYDPIRNFSDTLTENIGDQKNNNETFSGTKTDTGTDTRLRTDNLSSTETRNLSGSQNEDTTYQMQGFNSTSFQNKDKDTASKTTSDSGTVKYDNTGSQENKLTRDLSSQNSETSQLEESYSRIRTVTRLGNIGNITSQKMLNEEIELWQWTYIKQILDDTKELLTLSIYQFIPS